MSEIAYEIRPRSDGRFVIFEAATGKVLDDAQGHGYASRTRAEKAAWYRFGGGKAKRDAARREATAFWRDHGPFAARVDDLLETWFKEIALGEIDVEAEVADMAADMGVEWFRPEFLVYR